MLRFIDGFDHVATADLLGKWNTAPLGLTNSSIVTSAPSPRTGVGALGLGRQSTNQGEYLTVAIGANATTVILGTAFYFTAAPLTRTHFLTFGDGGATGGSGAHVYLTLNAAGTISVWLASASGGGAGAADTSLMTLHGTSGFGLSPGQWYYLEAKVLISNSVGTVEVRVNGVAWITLTGLDTYLSGGTYVNAVTLSGPSGPSGALYVYDDLYIADTVAGDGATDFLGPQKVKTVIASSGNGTATDWTPSTGTDHGANVDDATPNSDTDYNSSSTVNHRDSYNFAALGVTGVVSGVQAVGWMKTDISGSRSVNHYARISSTNYDGTTVGIDTTYRAVRQVWGQSPASSAAWTISEIDAAEFGVRVQA